MSQFDKLVAAGIIAADFPFSAYQKSIINGLSDNEVNAIITAKAKIGADPELIKHLPRWAFL